MILADTSVWISFLANRQPYPQQLDKLLDANGVVGHDFVYGELLLGNGGARRELLANYLQLYQLRSVPHAEVIEFVHARKLYGRGVGWIDVHLLASALVFKTYVWTAHSYLNSVASELNVAYEAK